MYRFFIIIHFFHKKRDWTPPCLQDHHVHSPGDIRDQRDHNRGPLPASVQNSATEGTQADQTQVRYSQRSAEKRGQNHVRFRNGGCQQRQCSPKGKAISIKLLRAS